MSKPGRSSQSTDVDASRRLKRRHEGAVWRGRRSAGVRARSRRRGSARRADGVIAIAAFAGGGSMSAVATRGVRAAIVDGGPRRIADDGIGAGCR